MIQPIHVEPHPGYRIWIRYADGVAGEVNLSDLAGRGVLQAWNDDIELCADALYLKLTDKPLEAVMTEAYRGLNTL